MRDSKQDILHFWFVESQPAQWFQKNDDFDALIRERFASTVQMVRDGLCDSWADQAEGALALCLVLDQFPRNIFREQPAAFSSDERALEVAIGAIAKGFDKIFVPQRRRFFYLPYEHSEFLEHQDRSVELFAAMKDEDPVAYEYALRHRDVIRRFGRFPHRNAALGRTSTPEEALYLSQPGAGF
jgi:uncharacterized protein (DUF924 family)